MDGNPGPEPEPEPDLVPSARLGRPPPPPPGLQQPNRVSNFLIEDILRPDFGRHGKVREGAGPRWGPVPQPEDPDQDPEPEPRRTALGGGREAEQVGAEAAAPSGERMLWPAWVYCTRYSDRPSAGPRSRRPKPARPPSREEKRPRTAFTAEQLSRLKTEFAANRYLTEQRRRRLAAELDLNEAQIKIWFQNKRAKIKKAAGGTNALARHLRAQGLYNHSAARGGHAASDSD